MHWYANPFDFVDFYMHTALDSLEGDLPSTTHTIYNENIHYSMATNGGGTLCRRYGAAVVHLIVNQESAKQQKQQHDAKEMPTWNVKHVVCFEAAMLER